MELEDNQFRIDYDDHPEDIIEKITELLKTFGLLVEIWEEGNGYIIYEIRREGTT